MLSKDLFCKAVYIIESEYNFQSVLAKTYLEFPGHGAPPINYLLNLSIELLEDCFAIKDNLILNWLEGNKNGLSTQEELYNHILKAYKQERLQAKDFTSLIYSIDSNLYYLDQLKKAARNSKKYIPVDNPLLPLITSILEEYFNTPKRFFHELFKAFSTSDFTKMEELFKIQNALDLSYPNRLYNFLIKEYCHEYN